MKRLWVKNYLFVGGIVMLLMACLCSTTFVRSNLQLVSDKHSFESIFVNTTIDFIIPSPSYQQVEELSNNTVAGIESITPFYETSTDIISDGATLKGTALVFSESTSLENTPYSSSRILNGSLPTSGGYAVMDQSYFEDNECGIGDTVSILIADKQYLFTVAAITEDNSIYNNGTIALVISADDDMVLQYSGVRYSAAYVSASNYDICKDYLYSEYRPYGRLKDQTEFPSKDMYDSHLQNFLGADWAQEITNFRENYDRLSVKYEKVDSATASNTTIASFIGALLVLFFNIYMLKKRSINQFMRINLVKKNGTITEVKAFYRNGILYTSIVYIVVSVALFLMQLKSYSVNMTEGNASVLWPAIAVIVASVVTTIIADSYVVKNYSVKIAHGAAYQHDSAISDSKAPVEAEVDEIVAGETMTEAIQQVENEQQTTEQISESKFDN